MVGRSGSTCEFHAPRGAAHRFEPIHGHERENQARRARLKRRLRTAPEQVPDWLSNRLRRMFSDVMDEPVPDEFKALLKQLEDKERGS